MAFLTSPCKDGLMGFLSDTDTHRSPEGHQMLLGCPPCGQLVSVIHCFVVMGVLPMQDCNTILQFSR